IKSVDIHKNAIKTQKVKNGSLRMGDLDKKTQDAIKKGGPAGPKGEQGPQGPQGPKGDSGSTRVTSFSNGFTTTVGSAGTVSFIGDGVEFGPYADGGVGFGSICYNGLSGQPVSSLKGVSYDVAYKTSGSADAPIGSPYFRIFTENNTHDFVYTPQQQADANVNEGEFVETVPFFGTLRYDDDPGSTPEVDAQTLLAAHATETISRLCITVGGSGGTDLEALLRWFEVNGTRYTFGA
ncbi:MAG: hypothetical protein ABIO16_02805, partial [Nocardioides sp.]